MTTTITALDAPLSELGECPVWSPIESALYWVDIEGRAIHRHHPGSGGTDTRTLDGRPGSIALTTQAGRLLVASEHQLLTLSWDDGASTPIADLEPPATGNRLNDGRCDPAGRFVVGSMFADTGARQATGILHRIDSALSPTVMRRDIGVTNGLAFDAERGRMYFADTPTEQVLVFDYDVDSGELSNQRVFFDYRDHQGKPDGACVDAEGCYWSASVYGWGLLRISPEGEVEQQVELPLHKPSMPCFGGPGLETLYVTTIGRGGTTPSEPGRDGFEPGAVLVVEGLGVRGVAEPHFR